MGGRGAVAAREVYHYTRPALYRKQYDAFFCDARYSIVEASTKSGKTVGALAWLTEQAALGGAPGRNYWWVAPVHAQARIAYERLKLGLTRQFYDSRETVLTIELKNGAVIWFKSAEKPDTLYGEDVYAAVIDEATRCREASWHAVRSTLTATGGPVRIVGNVKGRKNWAYKMARRAEAGEQDMSYHKITAYDAVEAGVLEASEVEDAKRMLPEHVFRELYLAEPSDDGGNPFGLSNIERSIRPLDAGTRAVCFGIDLARSVDYTVIVGLNAKGEVCVFERFQKPWRETIETILSTVTAPALVDSTGVGDPGCRPNPVR